MKIDTRQHTQDTLKAMNERFMIVMNSLEIGVCVSDMQTYEILFANECMRTQFHDELIGKICWQVLQRGQTAPCDFCTNNKLVTPEGEPTTGYNWEFQNTANQQWYYLQDRAIRWTDGRLVRLELATNITERKQAEQVLQWTLYELENQLAHLSRANQRLEQEIAEREKVAQALHAEEERFDLAMRGARDGVWDYNFTANTVYRSQRILEILGYNEHELGHTPAEWNSHIHPDDCEQVTNTIKQYFKKKITSHEITYRMRHKAGHYVWVLDRGSAVWNEAGEPIRAVGTIMDLTAQKQAEEALRESERYNRILLEESLMGLALIRVKDGTYTDVNPAYANIMGYSVTELLQNHLTYKDITAPQYAYLDEQQAYLAELTGRFGPYEKALIHKEGHLVPVRLSGLIIQIKGEQFFWSNTEDITAQKYTENALRQAKEAAEQANIQLGQLKTTLDLTLDCIFIANAETLQYLYVNQGATNLVGYSTAELLNKTPLDLIPEFTTKSLHNFIVPLLTRAQPALTFETFLKHKNGNLLPVEIFLQYIEISKEIGRFMMIARDITERKQITAQLNKAKEAAEVANRTKSSFLANMSHELRTPLNGILGYTQILGMDESLTPKQQEGIGVIHRCGEYLLTLINDILDLSKIEAGKIELIPTDFHLDEFLNGVVELFMMRAQQKGIDFEYEIASYTATTVKSSIGSGKEVAGKLPTVIHADEKRLRQILINLLGNAVKFTEQGKVTLRVDCQGGKVRFIIADTGVGIAAQDLPKIFLPFVQTGHYDQRVQGTGLGLSITKKLVEMMGGELRVESKLGKGSVFSVLLDLPASAETTKLPVPEQRLIVGYIHPENRNYKILVVDDKWENRAVLVSLLSPLGFDVIEANDGQEGVDRSRETHPDLVLMDLIMPGLSGFEATQQIRQIPTLQDVIVIAVSASAFSYHREESLSVGCNDFISKPVKYEVLLEQLRYYLKLTWVYGQSSAVPAPDSTIPLDEPLVAPSKAQAATLLDLAMRGDINGIVEYSKRLKQNHPELVPFAKNIYHLAKQLKMRQIREIAKYYLE